MVSDIPGSDEGDKKMKGPPPPPLDPMPRRWTTLPSHGVVFSHLEVLESRPPTITTMFSGFHCNLITGVWDNIYLHAIFHCRFVLTSIAYFMLTALLLLLLILM